MQKSYNLREIDIDLIQPNPYQPRQHFDDEMIADLSDSIKLYGVMQPISVRKLPNKKYELIAGERRLRAAKKAGLKKIPVLINQVNNKDLAVLALVENIQRENLNYIEEAEAYKKLIDTYGITQQEVANRVGKSQSTVANKLRILNLSTNVRDEIKKNGLTERHARALLKIKDEEKQLDVVNEIIEKKLTVKKTEQLIDKLSQDKKESDKVSIKKSLKDIRIVNNTILQAIKMLEDTGIDIHYEVKEMEDVYNINISIPIK